jgi:TnpA family transposase
VAAGDHRHLRRPPAGHLGEGSTAVASDSTHVGAFDQNIFTQWHSRYDGREVLLYWHVERKSMAIH